MKIETKFDIGETVYAIAFQAADYKSPPQYMLQRGPFVVKSISLQVFNDPAKVDVDVDSNLQDAFVQEVVYWLSPKMHPGMPFASIKEEYVFSSYQEARNAFRTIPLDNTGPDDTVMG